jgi:hypothetical protein
MKIFFAALVATCSSLLAADHLNLEEGLPTHLEDAYPIAYRGREIQTHLSYEHLDDGKDRVTLQPQFEFGFAPNAQGKIAAPFYLGDADKKDSGNIGLEAFYNFNTEGIYVPAFALSARADLPTGREAAGIDTTLKAIATKSVSRTGLDRVHLNAAWKRNAGRGTMEREHMYQLIAGYSRRLGADTVIVADYVREQEEEKGKTFDIIELGVRRQLTPLTVLSTGAGVGISKDSPDVRFTLGFQKSF